MDLKEAQSAPRESMDYDVVIVGAGPAGLAAAIRLKQLDEAISVVVVEKGSEVGAHILSGAVIDPIGLDKLLPDWREDEARPLHTQVSEDVFYFLGPAGGARLPNFAMPKLINNHGNFVGSLGLVARYLAARAEALGVEIYPGFAAAELSGEENADEMRAGNDGKPLFLSNHAGGILGGISTGQPIVARFAVKPTSSILSPRATVNRTGGETEMFTKGRHDPCVGIRAVPVGEAMVACVLADQYLRHRAQIGVVEPRWPKEDVDGRDKPDHDGEAQSQESS
eukprot:gene28657-36967_t